MKNTIKIHVPPSQQVMRNRTYNRHMRNLYYEKANYQFRKIRKFMDARVPPSDFNLLHEIYEFQELLNVCLSYSKNSLYSGKSENMVLYSQDHHWGILQEEILLAYFLEEQVSSVKYIISHIETNKRIQDFAKKTEADVIVNHIISNIDELNKETEKDLRYFYENIEKRYKIGNKLFGILQELQNF
jgi:replicative superfamily II helicase